MKHRKSVSLLLAGVTTVAMLTGPVQAAEAPSPQELAAAWLQSEGLMKGDENGELHLEDDLTRAELALPDQPHHPEPGTCGLGNGLVHPDVYHQFQRCS